MFLSLLVSSALAAPVPTQGTCRLPRNLARKAFAVDTGWFTRYSDGSLITWSGTDDVREVHYAQGVGYVDAYIGRDGVISVWTKVDHGDDGVMAYVDTLSTTDCAMVRALTRAGIDRMIASAYYSPN